MKEGGTTRHGHFDAGAIPGRTGKDVGPRRSKPWVSSIGRKEPAAKCHLGCPYLSCVAAGYTVAGSRRDAGVANGISSCLDWGASAATKQPWVGGFESAWPGTECLALARNSAPLSGRKKMVIWRGRLQPCTVLAPAVVMQGKNRSARAKHKIWGGFRRRRETWKTAGGTDSTDR